MDAISSLPDDVLGRILSSLSTKHAASTSVLSKRWRNVFVSVSNLDIDDGQSVRKTKRNRSDIPLNFIAFVDKLLDLQGDSPVKNLTLKTRVGVRDGVDVNRVHSWICSVLDRGVSDLDLFVTFRGKSQPLPCLIFKSKTLVKLRLGGGYTLKLSHDVSLPMLKTLWIDSVDFIDGVFENLLSRCPVLEDLVLLEQRWVHWSCSVSSSSLKRLSIRFDQNLSSISFDAPNLVYFYQSGCVLNKYPIVKLDSLVEATLKFRVDETRMQGARDGYDYCIPTDMINLINGIRNVRVLYLSSDALELLYFSCQEMPLFDSLVRLSIKSDKKRGWQMLPLLIKNSPNLETLIFMGLNHYVTKNCGDACVCNESEENITSCLSSSRVKVVGILGYKGSTSELNQTKHFLEKLPCLELVKICAVNDCNNFQVNMDMKNLMMHPRASPKFEIQDMFLATKKEMIQMV